MGIYRVSSVPLIAQKTDGVCWFASAWMLAEWRTATKGGLGTMTHPLKHTDAKQMYDRNSGMFGFSTGAFKRWIGLQEVDVPSDLAGWTATLTKYGPLWAAGQKTWNGSYPHVVVVFGAADTGLLINDPEPVGVGKEEWRTWSSMNKYFSESQSDYKLLACP